MLFFLMDGIKTEQKENKEKELETKTEDNGKETAKKQIPPETETTREISAIDRANNILTENKAVLNSLSEERKKIEEAIAEIKLAGHSKLIREPEKTEAEKYHEDAKKRYEGTGLNPAELKEPVFR